MLEAFNMREKTVLTSFSYERIKNARAYNPGYRVGLLYGEEEPDPEGKLKAIGGEELCPPAQSLTRECVERYHAMEEDMKRISQQFFDIYFCDFQ